MSEYWKEDNLESMRLTEEEISLSLDDLPGDLPDDLPDFLPGDLTTHSNHNISFIRKIVMNENLSLSTGVSNTTGLLDMMLPHNLTPVDFPGTMPPELEYSLPWSLSLAVPQHMLLALILMYAPIIIFAVAGSILVILSVIRSPSLRTASNSYLVNLALSDLLLAGLTCPITLSQLVYKHWQFPIYEPLCSLSAFLPLFFSFLSTFTITVIALDRHHLIVHTSQPKYRSLVSCIALTAIWIAAFLCAAPILPNTRIDVHELPEPVSNLLGISKRAYCREDWNYQNGRLLYSIFTLLVQLLLPTAILTMAHARIYRKLQSLPFWNRRATPTPPNPDTVEKLGQHVHAIVAFVRQQTVTTETVATTAESGARPALLPPRVSQRGRGSRTLYLLICVLVVFVISWLPLNTLNVLLDVGYKQALFGKSEVGFRVAFALCHLLGMSSAISNPIIYGYFNQGFREEFMRVLLPCKKNNDNNHQQQPIINIVQKAHVTTKM